VTSFRPMGTEYNYPPEIFPSTPTLDAYRVVLSSSDKTLNLDELKQRRTESGSDMDGVGEGNAFLSSGNTQLAKGLGFGRPIMNSLIVSGSVVVLNLFLASLAAYAIARLRFRWKIHSLLFLWMAGMIPPVVTIAPVFVLLRALGLLQSLPGLIIPYTIYTLPLSIWLLSAYFAELPWELEDAGKIDGYNPLKVYWYIVLPLTKPGLFSAGIFAFLASWGEFMFANAVTMGIDKVRTIPVSILQFSYEFRFQWTWIAAGIVITIVLVATVTLIFQRWIIQGLSAGSVK
jgi:multiple sugar transport system permease protein